MELVHIWIGLVGLVIILYVVLDGFTLGIGMLFPIAADERERDVMMNAIAPVWDANQTWIVFGGGALFATFPLIYTVLFSALYVPLLTFIFGLIFRGVAFEFRATSGRKTQWNSSFFWGSMVATFAQGVTLGAYIGGIEVKDGLFAGGAFDWFTPFSITVGFALISGYILLGATYLIIKTEGAVQARAYAQARWAAWVVAGFMAIVSLWTPDVDPAIPARWFSEPRIYFIWIFPLMGLTAFIALHVAISRKREVWPFVFTLLLFLSAYVGLQAALYPYAVLPDITIYEAAAQPKTMIFTLWGVGLILPFVLGYTIYSYSVFRGKVDAGEGYH